MATTPAPDLWPPVRELRSLSRVVLAALEQDDFDTVKRLAERSDILLRQVTAALKARNDSADRSERIEIEASLRDLQTVNRAIVARIERQKAEALAALRETRNARLRIASWRGSRAGGGFDGRA